MALSILGRCPRTGNVGLVVASAHVAAGSRTVAREAGVGVVVDLSAAESASGGRALALLRAGQSAAEAGRHEQSSEVRPVAVIDAAGRIAAPQANSGRAAAAETEAGCAITDEPARADVLAAALAVLAEHPDLPLAERLVRALTHAEDSADSVREGSTLRSAHLLVLGPGGATDVDLRVDWHRHPVGALRALWNRYATTALACVRSGTTQQAAAD